MAKLLVAEQQRTLRKALKDTLVNCSYDVFDAANGPAALEITQQEEIDGILLAAEMPGMDGWQVLGKLKEDPRTKSIPVIMLISYPSVETEATGVRLGAAHLISKPWHPETLAITVKVALREAQNSTEESHSNETSGQGATPGQAAPASPKKFIDTGGKLIAIEKVLNGGIPSETLTLIEGDSAEATSVLCQYLTYGALLGGQDVAYFTNERMATSLFDRMRSIGLDVSGYDHLGRVKFHPMQIPSVDDEPENLMAALASDIERIPCNEEIIIVDSISGLAEISEDRATLRFFSACHRLSSEGRIIIVVCRSSAIERSTGTRIHGVCDTHIKLSTESIRNKLVNTLQVLKVNKAELRSDAGFSFEVTPGVGVTIVPMSRIKA